MNTKKCRAMKQAITCKINFADMTLSLLKASLHPGEKLFRWQIYSALKPKIERQSSINMTRPHRNPVSWGRVIFGLKLRSNWDIRFSIL